MVKRKVIRMKKKKIRRRKSSTNFFKGAFKLPIETAVYVPSTKKGQKKIKQIVMKKRVQNVRKFLSQKYGGYTSIKAIGGYIGKKGKLIKEPVVKVTSFSTKKAFVKNRPIIKKKLLYWKKKWGQESMGYEHEGDLYYFE